MPVTYNLIASNTLSSSAASVTFSAIPNTYTDLVLRISARYNAVSDYANIRISFNGATTTYSDTVVAGFSGTSTFSSRNTGQAYIERMYVGGANITSNTFTSGEIYIPNYAGSTNKPISGFNAVENNSSSVNIITAVAGLWSNTSAITSINLALPSDSFVSGSSFFLYGIKNS